MKHLSLIALLAAVALLWIGERVMHGTVAWVLDGVGLAALLVAMGLVSMRWRRARDTARAAYGWLLLHQAVVALGVALYALVSDTLGLVGPGTLRTVLMVVWPALVLLGLLPAVAMELSIASMAMAPKVEAWRVALAARSAQIFALALVAFAGLNYAANAWNHKTDLTYFRTTEPGESTLKVVENLVSPVMVQLFFPPGNEVVERIEAFLAPLQQTSPLVQVTVLDHAFAPDAARRAEVRANGYMVVEFGEKREKLRFGLTLESAKKTLRELDQRFNTMLLEVLEPRRVAYLISGHGERDWSPPLGEPRAGVNDLRQLLEALSFDVKRLGLSEGLSVKVPEDASLVLSVGATDELSTAERAALLAYLRGGGRVLWALDPDQSRVVDPILGELGLTLEPGLVAEDRYLVRVEGRRESPYLLATANTGRHPSTETLSKYGARVALVVAGAGSLQRKSDTPASLEVVFPLLSMSNAWLDENLNGKLDKDAEKRSAWRIAAAVSGKLPAEKLAALNSGNDAASAASADDSRKTNVAPEGVEMRAVVLADADMVSNGLIVPATEIFLRDSLRWLVGAEAAIGAVNEEEDVPLVHRKDEDAVWFYGTSMLMPALVLGLGLLVSRRTGRKGGSRA